MNVRGNRQKFHSEQDRFFNSAAVLRRKQVVDLEQPPMDVPVKRSAAPRIAKLPECRFVACLDEAHSKSLVRKASPVVGVEQIALVPAHLAEVAVALVVPKAGLVKVFALELAESPKVDEDRPFEILSPLFRRVGH